MGYGSRLSELVKIWISEKDAFEAARTEFEQRWSKAKCKWLFGGLRQDILWDKIAKKHRVFEFTSVYGSI
jgi:hypothetical protein